MNADQNHVMNWDTKILLKHELSNFDQGLGRITERKEL